MPVPLQLQAGVHWWCSCALSCHQPLCDGSHTGSGKGPVKFVLTEARTVVLCDCKHTATDEGRGTWPVSELAYLSGEKSVAFMYTDLTPSGLTVSGPSFSLSALSLTHSGSARKSSKDFMPAALLA